MRLAQIVLSIAALVAAHFSIAASAQQSPLFADVSFGEILVRAAASKILENKTQALKIFNKREEGNFRYGDWYVFCYRADTGEMESDPAGTNIMDFRDPYDRPVGILIFKASPKEDHKIEAITYMAYRPAPAEQVPFWKKTWLIKVGDLVCGVGDYFQAVANAPIQLERTHATKSGAAREALNISADATTGPAR
jgi:hypothetical protein